MAEPKPRVFEYTVTHDGERFATARDATIELPEQWAPEHLVLTALIDCSLTSLRYHAKRAGIEVVEASGEASGTVTRRESDGRFAFVGVDCRLTARLRPPAGELDELLAKTERDCFVGASLTVAPRYAWHVT